MPHLTAPRGLLTGVAAASLAATAFVAVSAPPAAAATFQVTTLGDSGGGSLRQAVVLANGAPGVDTITFQAGLSGTISLTSGPLVNAGQLTISGPGQDVLTVSGNGATRVFENTGDLTVSDLTIADGSSPDHGSGVVNHAGITLERVTLAGNSASGFANYGVALVTDSTFGGPSSGIWNEADLTVTGSTFSGLLSVLGPAIVNGFSVGTAVATISRSTFAANTVVFFQGGGGAIANAATMTIDDSTFSGNTAGFGASILAMAGSVTLTNTILDTDSPNANCAGGGAIVDGGHNLSSDASCVSAATSLPSTDPALGALADNGGPTQTMLPQEGSPAIDAGGNACLATDQRGLARPQGTACDIGAVEVEAALFDFDGFYAPIDNRDANGHLILNKAKGGSAIPVKFSLGGNQGLDIFEAGYPASTTIACDSNAEVDAVETTATAGQSGLSYNAATDTYTYVWKTQKPWGNPSTCRQLVVKLSDGSTHRANFWFTK